MSGIMSAAVSDPETLYTRQACIGGGSFGKVYKGIDKNNGQTVAIKVIDVENADDEVDNIIQEISMLSGLNSPYLTKYYGSYLKGTDLWIIMEYCSGGSCADLLRSGALSEDQICIVVRGLLNGLEYLHSDGKLHRDIKAANVLVGSDGQVKLGDFGMSGQLTATMTKKDTFVGTPLWMAPEVITQSGHDHTADIWSLGITALELAQGEPPHSEIHPMKVLFLVPKAPAPTLQGNFSTGFKDFVHTCLRKVPRERPSALELLKHPWVRQAKKATYLTELIEQHERWQAAHEDEKDMGGNDLCAGSPGKDIEKEDPWDFGTVGPILWRAKDGSDASPLQAMTEAGMGSRRPHVPAPSTSCSLSAKDKSCYEGNKIGINRRRVRDIVAPSQLPRTPLPMDKSRAIPSLHPAAAKVSLPRTPTRKPAVLQEQHISRPSGQSEPVLARPRSSATPQPPSLLDDDSPLQCTHSGMLRYISASNLEEKRITSQQLQQAQYGSVAGRSDTQREPPNVNESQDLPDIYQKALWRFAPPANEMHSLGQRAAAISSNGAGRWSSLQSARNGVCTTPSQQQIRQISSHPEQSPPRDRHVTVLNSVILPALETALDRRSYHLNLVQQHVASQTSRAFNPSGLASGVVQHSTISEDILLMCQTHDQIRERMGKIVRLFEEMDYWDGVAPVLSSDGVEGLLEGFLQEVLRLVDVGVV